MCLTKKSMIPRIALKDIVVYKVLVGNPKVHLYTPITEDKIVIGKTYKGVFQESKTPFPPPKIFPRNLITSLFSKNIESGYIHSKIYPNLYGRENRVNVKCIIPKGTLYFIGDNFDIASRKLKYVEIIR